MDNCDIDVFSLNGVGVSLTSFSMLVLKAGLTGIQD